MRANTSRGRRLAFDSVADLYDRIRPRFDGEPVADLLARVGLRTGGRVVEVGAGTGQVTGALVAAGLSVLALEPGPRLAARLRGNLRDGCEVREVFFEDFDPSGQTFAAVISANAFHWIDPKVSYPKAASILATGGALALLWDYPIVADAGLQQKLNDRAYVDSLGDLARDPNRFGDDLNELLAAGRAELVASGRFEAPWWHLYTTRRELSGDDYIALMASFANSVDAEPLLRARLRPLLPRHGSVLLTDYVYVCVAVVTARR